MVACGQSDLYSIWVVAVIVYKLLLHVFGLVLSFLNRNIQIDALNDSTYLAAITYCSTFILVLLIFIAPLTADNPNQASAFICILFM